jgi:DNA-binding response OmpR family regulator
VNILIVDDEPADVETAGKALHDRGWKVFSADSYEAAIETFDQHADEINLAVLDISLPGHNGVDLFQELLRRKAGLKVLFISGHVGAEIIRFYGLRANDRHFLAKPFRPQELIARVEEIARSSEPLQLTDFEERPRTIPANGG